MPPVFATFYPNNLHFANAKQLSNYRLSYALFSIDLSKTTSFSLILFLVITF